MKEYFDEKEIALVELAVGFQCNNKCKFCSQEPSQRNQNKTTKEIKCDIIDAKNSGTDILGFTGGEPTIRKDIIKLVKFAKAQGFRTIRIQTNGKMFAYKEFTKKIIEAGANYFKFSIHGHIPEIHDYLTQSPGSLSQAVQGIKNIKSFNRTVENNIVINKFNYKFLPQTIKFLIDLGISRHVLIYATFLGNALINKDEIAVRITDALPYIRDALDIIADFNLDKAVLTSVPICFMNGYEKYASSDLYPYKTEVKGPGFDVNLDDKIVEEKRKCGKCKKCKYDKICGGLRYDYAEIFGFDEIVPVLGEKITSPNQITNNI